MKKILLFGSVVFGLALQSNAQSAYVLPSPTGADETMTLYIDVSATDGGLKAMLAAHPEVQDSVYLWTWSPNEPPAGNGNWGESNDAMLMTHVGGFLYSKTFVPTEFYSTTGPEFFTKGIKCLAKLKNGNAFADDAVGEAKTSDLAIVIIPKLCDDLYCKFPELTKSEDFFSITYDNNQETNVAMQNLGNDECYLYALAVYDDFGFDLDEYATPAMVTGTPALKMKPVPGQPGFFRLTIIADDFFTPNTPGAKVKTIKFYALRPGFTYTGGQAPIQVYDFLDCSN
jgi:hypothetical protein